MKTLGRVLQVLSSQYLAVQWEFINLSSNYLILLIFKTVLEGQPWHLRILIKYLVVLQRFSAPVTVLCWIYTPSKFQEGSTAFIRFQCFLCSLHDIFVFYQKYKKV